MEIAKKDLGVFLLERGKETLYTQMNLAGYSTPLPSDVVCDMEVISEEKLTQLIKRLLEANKIVIRGVIVILSLDYTFKNELEDESSEGLLEKLKAFQEMVPFENVESKIVKQEKKWKVICVSRDLCEKLKIVFEKMNIGFLGVVSYEALIDSFPEFSKSFDARLAMDKVEAIKLSGFVNQEEKILTSEKGKAPIEKKNNLSILLVVFGLLFVVLLVMIFFLRS